MMQRKLKQPTQGQVRYQLARVKKAMRAAGLNDQQRGELYGAMQALSWARGENAMAPARAFIPKERYS